MYEQDVPAIRRGEDVTLNFTMTPVTDISGWTISFRLKKTATDPAVLVTVNAVITTPTAGTFTVSLTAATTTTLSAGTYAYDVWRTDTGSRTGLAIGIIPVKGTVKQP